MAREGIVVLVVITCLVSAVAGILQDGLPRPTNIADEPFICHGPLPEAKYPDGRVANCKWYGFRNTMYSERTVAACVNELRTALVDPSLEVILEPFAYYYLAGDLGADPATDERYCYEGCFDIDSGSYNSPAPSPGGNFPEGPSLAPSPGGIFLEGPSLAPSPGGNFLAGPSLAPSPGGNFLEGPSLAPSPGGNFLEGPSLAPSPGGNFLEGPSLAPSPRGNFLRRPSLAPSPRGNLLRGPSLAPLFSPQLSPCQSRAPVPSPAFAPTLETPTPTLESGA